MISRTVARVVATGLIAACAAPIAAVAESPAEFYAGKTVTLIVGFPPGGGMDLYARLAGDHWGRFIPGHPNVIVQNMPGGGGVKATRHLFTVARRDGTQIGLMLPYVVATMMLRKEKTVRPAEFAWLGRIDDQVSFAIARKDAPISSVADARKRSVALGATSAQSISATVAYALNSLTGTKFKVVKGYRGTSPLAQALETGEIQVVGALSWAMLDTRLRRWTDKDQVKLLWVISPRRFAARPNVPAVRELSDDPKARPVLEFLGKGPAPGRSFIAPPGTPADRVAALRSSFMAMVKDPRFLADAKKRRLAVDPLPGEEVQKIVADVVHTPADVVERTRMAIKPQ